MIALKFAIIISVLFLMIIGGIYTYRYLNNRLMSSKTTFGLIFYALLLFIGIASIYGGGLFLMTWIYKYLNA